MIAFQILSDLHLEVFKEYDSFRITPKAPYLALLGDIGCVEKHKDEYLAFLLHQLSQFKAVFLVLGNHESYYSNWSFVKTTFNDFHTIVQQKRSNGDQLGEFVLLDQKRYDIDDGDEKVAILGCTLFSHIPAESAEIVSKRVNDFQYIQDWSSEQHNRAHESDVRWLDTQIQSLQGLGRRVVILTHYSPTVDKRGVDPRHKDSVVASNFATDLRGHTCWASDTAKLWAFGHTHFNCDYEGQTGKRIYANQRGYFGSSEGFDPDQVVKI